MRRILVTTLSALVLTALGAAPARAAEAEATVEVLWTTIVARGAAVDVAFAVGCPAGYTGSTAVTLAQVRDDGLRAHGTAVAGLTCAGTSQLFLQRVTADVTGAPFTRGRATLAMQVVGCDDTECFGTPHNQTTRITNLP